MNREIRFEKIKPSDVQMIAQVYAEVFAEAPWNEATKCRGCQRFYGLDTKVGIPCPDISCGGTLNEAYPLAQTIDYIDTEINRSYAVANSIKVEDQIVGFSWGFGYPKVADFAKEKCSTQKGRDIVSYVLSEYLGQGPVFYGSEGGILSPFRQKGQGTLMVQTNLTRAREFGLPYFGRTNCDSPMARIMKRAGLEQVLGPEIIADQSGQYSISQRVLNSLDPENPSRVFFVAR